MKTKGQITVAYDMVGTNWKLSVSDDGIGKPDGAFAHGKSGLGNRYRQGAFATARCPG